MICYIAEISFKAAQTLIYALSLLCCPKNIAYISQVKTAHID